MPSNHDGRLFMFLMLIVDFMHEWELNFWKGLLIHLIRLVTTQGGRAIHNLDAQSIQRAFVITTVLTISQFPSHPALQVGHHLQIQLEDIQLNAACCPRLRRYPFG